MIIRKILTVTVTITAVLMVVFSCVMNQMRVIKFQKLWKNRAFCATCLTGVSFKKN